MGEEHLESRRGRPGMAVYVALFVGAVAVVAALMIALPRYSQLRRRADGFAKTNADLTRQRDSLKVENAALAKQKNCLTARNAELEKRLKAESAELEERLRTVSAELAQERDALRSQVAALEKERARLAGEAKDASAKIAAQASELKKLRPLVDTIEAFNNTLLVKTYDGAEPWSGFEDLLPGRGAQVLQYAVDRFFEIWNLNVAKMQAAGAGHVWPKHRGVNHPEIGARLR